MITLMVELNEVETKGYKALVMIRILMLRS
jgi:hypothetical protein